MSVDGFSNAYSTTLNGSITNVATSLVVTSATGAPSVVPFRLRLLAEGANTTEIVTVTAVSGTTFTITRASEAYTGVQTASAHGNGATVEHVLTAGALMTLASATASIGVRVYNSVDQNVSSGATTALTFDSERYDSDGFHSTSSNTSRFTIPTGMGGKYVFGGSVRWSTVTGAKQDLLAIRLNGSTIIATQGSNTVATNQNFMAIEAIYDLAASDYIELVVQNNESSTITIQFAGNYSPEFWMHKLDSGKVGNGIGTRAYRSTTQSITDNTWTAVLFDSESFDTDGFHDVSSNTSRFTVPTGLGGKYIMAATTSWAASSAGFRYIAFAKNGTRILQVQHAGQNVSGFDRSMTDVIDLVPTDYVEVHVYQDSGSSLNLSALTFMSFMRLDSGSTGLTVTESDGSPSGVAIDTLVFPNDSVTVSSRTATIRQVPYGFIGAAIYASGNVSTSNSGEAVTAMDSELYDTDGFHDTVTNNGRFTIPAGLGGKYIITYNIHLSSTPGSNGYIIIRKNNSSIVSMSEFHWDGSSHGSSTGSGMVDLAAGDYIEMKNLTATIATMTGGTTWAPWFSITKLDSGKVGSGIGASVYNSANQTVNDAVVLYDSELFDTDGFHSTSSNTSRMTIPTGLGGKYLVTASVYDATGACTRSIRKNASVTGTIEVTNASGEGATITGVLDLISGDYVEIFASTGGAHTINGGSPSSSGSNTTFSIMRLDSGSIGIPPGYEYDYAQITANVTPTATTEGTANTVVTGNAVTYDGATNIMVEFYCPNFRSDTGGAARIDLWLYDSGSSIGRLAINGPSAGYINLPAHVMRRLTPSAGSHTYSIRASVDTGTGLIGAGSGGTGNSSPAFIRITKV